MAKNTKISLKKERVIQNNTDNLILSGSTYINALSANTFSIVNDPLVGNEQDVVLVRNNTTGEIKEVAQRDLDVFESLEVFYVDSNNPQTGDGSILNPYKSLDLAYSAVTGSGTVSNPEFENITISVAGGAYTTGLNIAVNTTTWLFSAGVTVDYTGSSFLIDTTALANMDSYMNVFGKGEFTTADGSFINAVGSDSTSQGKKLTFECQSLTSTYNNTSDASIKPLIMCKNPDGGTNGDQRILYLVVAERVRSFTQQIFVSENSPLFVVNGGRVNTIFSIGNSSIGNVADNAYIFNIGDTFSGIINNLTLFGYSTDAYIKLANTDATPTVVGRVEISNIIARTTRQANLQPKRFLQIDDFKYDSGIVFTESRVILRNIDYVESAFSDKDNYFQYIGTDSTFLNLELYNSRLPYPIDPKIILNNNIITSTDSPSATGNTFNNIQVENTIAGRFNISNITSGEGEVLLIDEGGNVSKASGSTNDLSGERIQKRITQTAHGFVVGDVVSVSGGQYIKSLSVDGQPDPLGIITEVNSVNDFVITYAGYSDELSSMTDVDGLGISADTVYYVSSSVSGKLTSTEPTEDSNITKPILFTINNTSGNILPYRGILISSGDTGSLDGGGALFYTGVTISGDSTTTNFAINHGFETKDVLVQVYEEAFPYAGILVVAERTDISTVTISFDNPPASGVNYKVLIYAGTEGVPSSSSGTTTSGVEFGDWKDIENRSNLITNTQIPLQYRFDNDPDSEIVYLRGQFGRNINSPTGTTWIIGEIPLEARPTYEYVTYGKKDAFEYELNILTDGTISLRSVDGSTFPKTPSNTIDPDPYQINNVFYRPNNPFTVVNSAEQHYIGFSPTEYDGVGNVGSQTVDVTTLNTFLNGAVINALSTYTYVFEPVYSYNDTELTQFGNNISVTMNAGNISETTTISQQGSTHTGTTLSLISTSDQAVLPTNDTAIIYWSGSTGSGGGSTDGTTTSFSSLGDATDETIAREKELSVGISSPSNSTITIEGELIETNGSSRLSYSTTGNASEGGSFSSIVTSNTVGATGTISVSSNDNLVFKVRVDQNQNSFGRFLITITSVSSGSVGSNNTVQLYHILN